MLPAIGFNDKAMFNTNKINYKSSDWMLTPEFVIRKLSATQSSP